MAWTTLEFMNKYAKFRRIVREEYMKDNEISSGTDLTDYDWATINLWTLANSITPEDTRYFKTLRMTNYANRWGYLDSQYWAILSESVRVIRKNQCELCHSSDASLKTEVHHLGYLNCGCEFEHLDDLQLLCSSCHKKVHNR